MDIRIKVNNEEVSIEKGVTVQQLLELRGYGKRAAVWVNGNQLLKSQYADHILAGGDLVKILRLTGGG